MSNPPEVDADVNAPPKEKIKIHEKKITVIEGAKNQDFSIPIDLLARYAPALFDEAELLKPETFQIRHIYIDIGTFTLFSIWIKNLAEVTSNPSRALVGSGSQKALHLIKLYIFASRASIKLRYQTLLELASYISLESLALLKSCIIFGLVAEEDRRGRAKCLLGTKEMNLAYDETGAGDPLRKLLVCTWFTENPPVKILATYPRRFVGDSIGEWTRMVEEDEEAEILEEDRKAKVKQNLEKEVQKWRALAR